MQKQLGEKCCDVGSLFQIAWQKQKNKKQKPHTQKQDNRKIDKANMAKILRLLNLSVPYTGVHYTTFSTILYV